MADNKEDIENFISLLNNINEYGRYSNGDLNEKHEDLVKFKLLEITYKVRTIVNVLSQKKEYDKIDWIQIKDTCTKQLLKPIHNYYFPRTYKSFLSIINEVKGYIYSLEFEQILSNNESQNNETPRKNLRQTKSVWTIRKK